jgi:hypothetical protein
MKYVPLSVDAVLRADEAPDTAEPNKLQLLQAEQPGRYINHRAFPPSWEPASMFLINHRLWALRAMGIIPVHIKN